jgi:hypothetical protein
MGAGAFEEAPLRTDYEGEFVVSVGLDLANLSNQLNYGAPTKIARQFAVDKAVE